MAYRAALFNFSKGEISPELQARFDISIYNAGLKRARNVKVLRTGGVAKRMGTRFVAECLSSTTVRLAPFQFSDEQAYALEMGQAYMRPLALGGAVLEEGLRVTGITNAVQAVITVPFHAYTVGRQVYLSAIEGMTDINDRFLTITAIVDANNIRVDFDSTNAGAFTGSGGGTLRVGAPPAPPAPPAVPPPLDPPEEPPVGSGSGGGYGSGGSWRTVSGTDIP
jgi:hypothetical protein